jgi:hypothetical protein
MSEGLRQLNVNVPAGLIRECKHAAIDSDQSLSAFVAEALHRHLSGLRRAGSPNAGGERPWEHAGLVSPPSNGWTHDS